MAKTILKLLCFRYNCGKRVASSKIMYPKWVSPQFVKVGLPMMSFVLLGAYGIQYTLKGRFVDRDRRRRGPAEIESKEDILQKMQQDLAGKEVDFVPVPGKPQVDTNTREYLAKELEGLRESERWTGMSLAQQKADVKRKLKALQ